MKIRNSRDTDSGIYEESDDSETDADKLESTDIESDEERDGDVDADGASAIPSRNR
jgi:hypothetical protein